MPFPVEAYEGEISKIVADVFETMFRTEVETVEENWEPRPGSLTAAIFFAGAWKGAVLLECSETLARRWTSRLLSMTEPTEVTDDVRDAMGELVNMVGGNLKSVLPRGVGLSMPSVVQGRNYSMRICGGNLVNRQVFCCGPERFAITLVEVLEPA